VGSWQKLSIDSNTSAIESTMKHRLHLQQSVQLTMTRSQKRARLLEKKQSTACTSQVCANQAQFWFPKQEQQAQLMQDEHGMHSFLILQLR